MKQKQYYKKFNKDLEKVFHVKKFKKKFSTYACVQAQSLQFCLTPHCPMDCSPPDFSVRGILQTRILEWVAMPSSRGSSWPKGWRHGPCASCIGRQILSCWATREALVMPEPLLNYDTDKMWLWRLSLSLDFPSSISPLQGTHPHFYHCPPPGLPFSCWPHHLPGCSQTEITQWVCL